MKRKLLSILLSVAMVMVMMPSMAFATTDSLADQILNADDGATVTLTSDVAVTEGIPITKNVTIDLNGQTLQSNATSCFIVSGAGNLTVKDTADTKGKIEVSGEAFRVYSKDSNQAKLTIEESVNVESTADACVFIYGNAILNTSGVLRNKSDYATVMTHGNYNQTIVNVNGGLIENVEGTAIYFANGTELNISKGTITGYNAVSAKGGNVNISGTAVLHAVGEAADPDTAQGSGTNETGDAFYIEDNYKPAVIANITGGTFISDHAKAVNILFKQEEKGSTISVTGGTFSDSSALSYLGAEADIIIELAQAVNQDITIPAGKTVTIDLKGNTLTGKVKQYGNLTIKNGTVAGQVNVYATSEDKAYNHLVVEEDAIIKSYYAVILRENSVGVKNYGSIIDIYGCLNGNIWVMGNIETDLATAQNPCIVNVHDGAIIDAGEGNLGICLAGAAKLKVGKANITSDTGIEVRAGELVVNGATIKGNATPTKVEENGNGSTTDGAGIAIAQHTTKLPVDVTITSGIISGYTALFESNPQNNETMEIVNISVNGGEFKAINGGVNSVYSENKTKFINGGTFSSDPTTYIADGAKVYHTSTGVYNVNNDAHTNGNNTWTYNDETKLYEESYVAPYVPPIEKDPVSNEGTAGTDDATTSADITDKVTTSDGKTEAVVDQDVADKIVDKAVENKSTEVVVEATTAAGTSDASQVALPETTVKAIAEQTDAALTIKTDNAEVTLDKEAVNAVADQAGTTGTVKLVVETVENTDDKVVVELKLETSNGYVSDFKGGNVSVTVPVVKDMADKKVVCVYIDDNGIYHKVDGSLNEAGTHYTFTTGHFSTYAIMSEEEADAVIKDQTAAAQKAAIKKVKTTVTLSTKNVKKGIKVTVKVPVDQKADKTGIILYRSMKKGSGYAMYKKVETKNSTYIITNTKNVKGNRLTAGKRYYYKARAYKVIDGKTYYGPMSTVKYMKAK